MERTNEIEAASEEILNRLVAQYQTPLRRMCFVILRDEELAKDAVIADNFHGMYLMTEYLYEHETITGKEFMKIFRELKGIPEPGQEAEAAVSDDMFVDDEV